MSQRTILFKGNPLRLEGPEIKTGDKAPEFKVLDEGLNPVSLSDFSGKVRLISVVPSLDTQVCEMQTRRFNEEASKLPENVAIMTVSMDLPFAQKRFCSTHGIDRVKVLSDHREASFGMAYGVLIPELRLLARSIFVVDAQDMVRYTEIVPEVTTHPDYDKALAAARELA
ncbi:MAG: thiol peroxidase [Deltaproteobacteria bacterium]|nr:thiol peroxidase [Deltaproteobacteria bacterium]MBW2308890.1 thiol peroxidase [Deltaproteobacteria bacterium]